MLVMNKDKKSVWKLDKEDFLQATLEQRGDVWCLFCYIRNREAQDKNRLKRKPFFGSFRSKEKAKESLRNLMIALTDDKYVVIEDETQEEKES